MYIVIGGGGKVGIALIEDLTKRGHRVAVIDSRKEVCDYISGQFNNVIVVNGDMTNASALSDLHLEVADRFAAVSGNDEDNLVACELVRTLYKVPVTVARINNPRNYEIAKYFNVDFAIDFTGLVTKVVEEGIQLLNFIPLIPLAKGNFKLVEIKITSKSKVLNKSIKDLKLPENCLLISIMRGDQILIPTGSDKLLKDDYIVALVKADLEEACRKVFDYED